MASVTGAGDGSSRQAVAGSPQGRIAASRDKGIQAVDAGGPTHEGVVGGVGVRGVVGQRAEEVALEVEGAKGEKLQLGGDGAGHVRIDEVKGVQRDKAKQLGWDGANKSLLK